MKLNQLALATLALAGASQAFAAAPVQYLTGASASSVNVMKASRNLCAAAGGTFSLYKTSTSTSALGNVFTGVCSTSLQGAPGYTTVAMNVSGGSANAVTATTTATTFLDVGAASCTAITGTEALAATTFGSYNLFACSNVTTSQLSDGGFLDVEGSVFPTSVLSPTAYDAADFQLAGISQAFGVAVNSGLYNALQAAQFPAPSTCTTDTSIKFTAACQPSVSKAQIASLINNAKTSFAKTAGGKFLIGGASTDATQIVYCMRPQTSGTQQSAQLYFLNYGAAGNVFGGGVETIINNGLAFNATSATSKFAATLNSGSSDVRNCLNSNTTAAGTGTGYRFGILSLENNPLGGSDSYRFVKLNGVAGAQGTGSSDSNTATALTGEYDYVYETVAYCKTGTCPAVVDAIVGNLNVALPQGSSTAGLFTGKGVESRYSRGAGTTPKAAAPYIIRY
ncbi:MAG: hypothetical protein QM742_15685 [Aquabacterium sp.]